MGENKNVFQLIPKIDELLEDKAIKDLLNKMPRKLVVDSIRKEVDILRHDIGREGLSFEEVEARKSTIVNEIIKRANKKDSYKLKRVINGTGTVIHTNIGRSLISRKVIDNIGEIATNYSNLEYDLEKGERGSRYSHLEEIITEITGGEAAMVVNNNAAAVLLALSAIAKEKEVIVSRGELIEIGGSFRIPEVMEESGAKLVAVGTTNKTHLKDYENAITEETAALLKVHTSNYRILGFTSSVSAEELNELKVKYDIPLIEDLGSGVLVDLSKYGLEYEPTVQDSIENGIDVVTFSGDKLLGGPQAGIIVGKKEYIEKMKENPLTRAFRVDKFTISALEATLKLYMDEENAIKNIPTLRMLSITIEELEGKARNLYKLLEERIDSSKVEMKITDSYSEVGGGSLPLEEIASKSIKFKLKDGQSISSFESRLRDYQIPLIARIYKDEVYIDLRTIREDEFNIVVDAIEYGLKE